MTLHPLPKKTPPKTHKPSRAPTHLTTKTRAWWRQIVDSYQFENHELRLLTAAAESWDRKEKARDVIERDGLTYADRFGQPASRPEVAIERDSRLAFFRCMRQLALSEDGPENRPTPLRFGGKR